MATLITTIGTGGENKTTGAWEYSQAYYRYNDEGAVRTSYIGKALVDSSLGYKINRIIVFGTASTGWGNLIGGFGLENDPDCSDLWLDLKQVEEDARKDKSVGIDEEKLNTLRSLLNKKLSKDFQLYLIPIALQEIEIWEFLSVLAKSILDLPPDEEIYIDITHGLRHHQTMMASTLGFINKLSPNANRNLHLLYGAFQQGEDNTTPILNLDAIDSMHQWSEALNAFIGHGDYEILAGKIRKLPQQSAKQLANFLEKLSFEIAGNYVFTRKDGTMGTLNITLEQTKKQIEKFEIEAKQVGKNGETIAALLIFSQLKSWMEPFLQQKDSVQLLMTLAKDHLKRHRYLLALTSCYEGLRQYQSKVAGIRLTGNDDQEKKIQAKFSDRLQTITDRSLKVDFFVFCTNRIESNRKHSKINPPVSLRALRNQIVHCLPDNNSSQHVSAQGFKKNVTTAVEKTISIIEGLIKNGLN